MTSLKTAVASAERAVAAMMRREAPVRSGAQRAEREGAIDLMGWGLRVDRAEAAVSGGSVLWILRIRWWFNGEIICGHRSGNGTRGC
jgi:hypothetical protein